LLLIAQSISGAIARRNIWARLPEGAIRVIFAGTATVLPAESVNDTVATFGYTVSLKGLPHVERGLNISKKVRTGTTFFSTGLKKQGNRIYPPKFKGSVA
jgi:hypothetical protein